MINGQETKLMTGTLDYLVHQITDPSHKDSALRDVFLRTHKTVISSADLLAMLFVRFIGPSLDDPTPEQLKHQRGVMLKVHPTLI